jgi:acyl-[acyl-carrier-protein] desaturase
MDPEGLLEAFSQMMKKRITMPARLMSDGESQDLFGRFAAVAQRIGVYTARDYAEIIEHLLAFWKIPSLQGLSGDAAQAQDFLCGLPEHYRAFAEKVRGRLERQPKSAFAWIFNRSA